MIFNVRRAQNFISHTTFQPPGGTPHMKGEGMLVFSLRGVNSRFWSRLGCSGQNTIIFSHKSLY